MIRLHARTIKTTRKVSVTNTSNSMEINDASRIRERRKNMPMPQHTESRDQYRVITRVTTRWKNNNAYGHVNNAVYNAWMDIVTQFFREYWPTLPGTSIIPVATETPMSFKRPITHPADVDNGFRVEKIDNNSVRCGVGIPVDSETEAAAWGHMIHIRVDREVNQSVPVPAEVRQGLEPTLMNERNPR